MQDSAANKKALKKKRQQESARIVAAAKQASLTLDQHTPFNSFDVIIDAKDLDEIPRIYVVPPITDPSKKHKKKSRELQAAAMEHEAEEKYVECIAALTEAIKLDPTVPELFLARGKAYLQLNRVQACIGDCTTAIIHWNTTNTEPFRLRARAHGLAGDWLRACLDFYVCRLTNAGDEEAMAWFVEARKAAQTELDILWFNAVKMQFLEIPHLVEEITTRDSEDALQYVPLVDECVEKITVNRRNVLRVLEDPFSERLCTAIARCKGYMISLKYDKFVPDLGVVFKAVPSWLEPFLKNAKGPLVKVSMADVPDTSYHAQLPRGLIALDGSMLTSLPSPDKMTTCKTLTAQSPYYNLDYRVLATGFLPNGPIPTQQVPPPPLPPKDERRPNGSPISTTSCTKETFGGTTCLPLPPKEGRRPNDTPIPTNCTKETFGGTTCIKIPLDSKISKLAVAVRKTTEVEEKRTQEPEVEGEKPNKEMKSVASQTIPWGIPADDPRYSHWCKALTGEWEHLQPNISTN